MIHNCNIGENAFVKSEYSSHEERAKAIGWEKRENVGQYANGKEYVVVYYVNPNNGKTNFV